MNISTSGGLFTHESVMNALVRDLLASPSSSSPESVTVERLSCLVIKGYESPLTSESLKQISESMRDTYTDASCKSSSSISEQISLNLNSTLQNNQDLSPPLTLLPNNAGAVDEEIAGVTCLECDCFDCQTTSPESFRESILDCIQNLKTSTTKASHIYQLDYYLLSNGLIKLVQALKDTRITSLNLSYNKINCDLLIDLAQYLPSTQIKSLDVSKNTISHKGFEYLNKILKKTQISSLHVSKNSSIAELTYRKHAKNELSIDEAHLVQCDNQSYINEILENTAIKYLDLSSSCIEYDLNWKVDPKYIISILKKSKIEQLNLTGSLIGWFNDRSARHTLFVPYLVDSNVTTLNLSNCGLGYNGVEFLASVLKNTKLVSLDLSTNCIGDDGLKVFVPCLVESQITYLNLSMNYFSSDGISNLARVLPKTQINKLDIDFSWMVSNWHELSACLVHTKLTLLAFRGNVRNSFGMESLTVGVKKSQIKSIVLGNNEAADIVQLLSLCVVGSQLTSITLSNCGIDCTVMEDLVIALRKSNITSIDIIDTSMTCDVMRIFVSCLVNSKITHLRLSNKKLDVGAVECLALALKNTRISSLDLSRNGLDCESLKVLAPCLVGSTLTYLNLEGNRIDYSKNKGLARDDVRNDEGLRCLALALKKSQITNLKNKGLARDDVRNDEGLRCLALALKKSQITNLNLADNALTCKSLMNLVLSLPDTKITALKLSRNEICCNVFYLANVLKSTQISSLDLGRMDKSYKLVRIFEQSHKLGRKRDIVSNINPSLDLTRLIRCRFFFNYIFHKDLMQPHKITSLNLSENQISSCEELKELCQFLASSKIVSLNLSRNNIECNGVYYLAQVLRNTQISSLNLASNDISINGVKHLALKLPGSQLKSLNLSHNLITDESIEYLSRNLVNSKITDLNLTGNQIGRQTVEHLCESVTEIVVQFDLLNDDASHNFNLCKYPVCIIEIYQTSFKKGIDHIINYVRNNTTETIKVYIRSMKDNFWSNGSFFELNNPANLNNFAQFSSINITEIEIEELSEFPYFLFKNISLLKLNGIRSEYAPGDRGEKIIELRLQNIQKLEYKLQQKFRFSNILYLDISKNNLKDDDFGCLVKAMKCNSVENKNKNDYLISLNLSNNKLGARSVGLLAEVLPCIPSLSYIDLHGNNIGHSGFKSLMEIVDKTSLCWLSLGDNNIEDQLQEDIELSPYIVPRKGDETPVAFQVRYLFRQLVSLNTCSGELEFTIPTTDSNPPVNITHYPKLLKIYSALENDVKYLNVHVYDNYYMKSKRHDKRLLEKIEKFGNEIEKRFLSFIDSISNQTKLEQAFGYDSFVVLVKECERLELNECVESLLLHRVLYYVDDDEEILHPFIYRMMHKYSMPLYCEQIEPNKRKQIIAYYQNHPEIEDVKALIDLLATMSTEEN